MVLAPTKLSVGVGVGCGAGAGSGLPAYSQAQILGNDESRKTQKNEGLD